MTGGAGRSGAEELGKQTAALTPAGDNKLTAALKPQPGAKALVRVTQPGLPVDQVRLSLP